MSKNAYYKHLKSLLENGYIKINKAKGFKNKNVYIICNNPKKVNCSAIENNDNEKSASLLSIDGINAKGYGFIPKLIMCDERLTVKAKGLIAFFYSLTQAGCRAFPHRSTICTFLNISKDIYYKALNQLIDFNYITVTQRHTKRGRFAVSDYILNSNPTAPCPEVYDITKNSVNTESLPCPKNEDILINGSVTEVSPCLENEDIKNINRVRKNETLPCLENCDNNNSTSINSNYRDKVLSNQEVGYIPYTQNKKYLKDLIYSLTRFNEYSETKTDFGNQYCKTVNLLIEMLSVSDHALYSKRLVKTTELFNCLNDCILDDLDGFSLRDLIMQTVWHYDFATGKYNIKRRSEYLKSLLWDNIYNFAL